MLTRFYVVLVLLFTLVSGCGLLVDETNVHTALSAAGFSDVKIEHKALFFLRYRGCSGSDDAMFFVRAKNPAGRRVPVTVCIGFFKDATIRYR